MNCKICKYYLYVFYLRKKPHTSRYEEIKYIKCRHPKINRTVKDINNPMCNKEYWNENDLYPYIYPARTLKRELNENIS